MSRNAIDRMKKQGSSQAKQNRTKRREESMKKYGRTSMSSSDKAYINGNYAKVASNKAYGYRQGVKKGEIVRGSENDWLSDGNIYRTTKVEENQSWKNHKNNKGKEKYAILSSHKWDRANTFKDHLNLGVADGLKTAKANQRKGKHISNLMEYGKGILKDTVVDLGVDTVKTLGAIGGYVQAGVSGFAEDSGNAFKALADSERTLKDYTKGKSYFVENIKSNTRKLNETGWGEDMATYLHEAKQRGDEETIQHLKEAGRYEDAKSYQEQIEKNKARDTNLLNATGFAMDLLAPSTIEDKILGVGKGLVKNTAKSFDEMVKGTANVSTGILPSEVAELMSKAKKYTSKGTGASDDVFFSGTKGTTATDKLLDNQYTKAIDRVKDKIKSNPSTSNLGKFVDELDNVKPYRGTQTNIDGRTLNKKYTQTKDGYIPQKTRSIADEINDVVNGKISGQYSMFGKDGTMDSYIKNVKDPYAKYENVLKKFDGDIDGLAEKLDSMKPQNADEMYDYIQRYKPNLYKELTKGSDEINNLLLKNDKYNLQNISDELSSVDKIKELNKRYNQLNERRLLESINGVETKIDPRLKVSKGKEVFTDRVGKYLFGELPDKSVEELEHVSALFDSMSKRLNNSNDSRVIAKELNGLIFGGTNVIRDNMYPNSLKNIVEYLGDIVNYQKAVKNGEEFVNFKNSKLPKEFKIFDEFGNLNLTKELDKSALYSPSATDSMFDAKRKDLGERFGIKNKELEIDTPLANYFDMKKNGKTLTEQEYKHFVELKNKQDAWKKVYNEIKDLNPSEYEEYARKNFNKNTGYNEMLDELAEKQARIDADKEIKFSKEASDLEAKRNREIGSVRHQQAQMNDVGELSIPKYTTEELHNIRANKIQEQKILNHKVNNIRKNFDLPKPNVNAKIKLTKGQKLGDLPPVKDNLANLKKTIQKEIRYMYENPDNYNEFKDAFKQVKLDYVNSLRNIGVPDDKYFHKVTALQEELMSKMNKLLQEGDTPLLKMELQQLASKVDETFKGFDGVVLDKIDDSSKYIDDMQNIFGVDQYLSKETKSTLNKNALTERSKEFLERTKKDPKGTQLKIDGRTLNKKYTQLKNPIEKLPIDESLTNDIVDNGSEQLNMFDKMLNKVDDNPFGDIDIEDALKEVENKEAVTLSDFFKKLEDNANKNTPVKEVVRDSKPIPSPSELISMGMTKDEAFDAVTKMRNGEMEIPDLNYKKKVGKDGYTRYERDGINLSKENTPLTKIENQPNPKYKDRKANWGDVYGDKNYVEEKRDLRKYIINPDTGEARLADAVRKPYPKNNNIAKELTRYDELNKFTDEGIKRLSKAAMGEDKELVNQILKERGLSVVDDVTEEVVEKAPKSFEEFLAEKGIDVEDIKNKSFADGEEEIYGRGLSENEIKANEKVLKKLPYEDEKLYGVYKSWLNTWKKGLTAYNPGWHVQNFFQNKGQNYLALGPEAFAPQTEARNILKQLNGKKAKDVNIFDKKNMRSYSSEEIGNLAQDLGVLDSLGEDVVNARGIFPKVENAIDNSGFMKWLNQSEQTARLNHFIKQIERGNSPEQAAKLVNKYLFDYSKKSNLDKVMGDFVDPFWTFHKNNAKLMATSALEHPNRINNIIRATNGLDYGVPQEQLQNEDYKYGKIQMPYASMKDSVNGDQYNYLYSENIMPNIEDALSLEDEDLENKLNPILKLALQHSRGEGNFGNKIVEGDEAGWNEVTKKELLGESLSELNPFAQNLFKTISSEKERQEKVDEGKMSQEVADKQILLDWINYITGNKGNLYRNLNY